MGGGKCLKNLKRGGAEKRGGNTKILKRGGGKLSEGVGLSPHFYGMLCAAPLNNINQMIKHYWMAADEQWEERKELGTSS